MRKFLVIPKFIAVPLVFLISVYVFSIITQICYFAIVAVAAIGADALGIKMDPNIRDIVQGIGYIAGFTIGFSGARKLYKRLINGRAPSENDGAINALSR